MALFERIETEMLEARRERDTIRLSALGLLKTELVNASKEPGAGGAIDDALVVRIARRELKRREEAIEAYRTAGREEAAQREEREAELLRGFLPAQLSDQELESQVAAIIAEVKPQGPAGFGAVMKLATARLAGRAEGAQIAATARKLLA